MFGRFYSANNSVKKRNVSKNKASSIFSQPGMIKPCRFIILSLLKLFFHYNLITLLSNREGKGITPISKLMLKTKKKTKQEPNLKMAPLAIGSHVVGTRFQRDCTGSILFKTQLDKPRVTWSAPMDVSAFFPPSSLQETGLDTSWHPCLTYHIIMIVSLNSLFQLRRHDLKDVF